MYIPYICKYLTGILQQSSSNWSSACVYMYDIPGVGLHCTNTLGSTLFIEYLQTVRELLCLCHKILRGKSNLQIKLKCIAWRPIMHGV